MMDLLCQKKEPSYVYSLLTNLRTFSRSLLRKNLFSKKLVFQLESILEQGKNVNKEKIWVYFHKVRSSQDFEHQWKVFLDSVKLPNEPLFYQHYAQKVFEKLIETKLKPTSVALCEMPTACLTSDEENAVWYVADIW